MIKEFNIKDLDKLNNLLSIFNTKLTNESFNNKFLKVLVYDDFKGVIVYSYLYDRIEIEYIVVDSKYRRKGIATKLLNSIEDVDITLEVKKSNKEAISFYKKNGFKEVSIRKKYYKNEDGILMMRSR